MLLLMQMSNELQRMEIEPFSTSSSRRCTPLTRERKHEPDYDIVHQNRACSRDISEKSAKQAEPVDVNVINIKSEHLLHAAIMASTNLTAISHLIKNGSDLNAVYNGLTPLTACLWFHKQSENTLSISKLLIEHGASVNLHSPLHIACQKGLVPVIELLLENGATPEILDSNSGFTPLQFTLNMLINSRSAIQADMYSKVALTLLQYSELDVTNCGMSGPSPLQLAVLSSNSAIILTVISKGNSHLSQVDIEQSLKMMKSSFTGPDESRDEIVRNLKSLDLITCPSLQEMSRNAIRKTMSRRLSGVKLLPCSNRMKKFILLDEFNWLNDEWRPAPESARSLRNSLRISSTSALPKSRMQQQAEIFLNFC